MRKLSIGLCLLLFFTLQASAQKDSMELAQTILKNDSIFWTAYNKCDIEGMNSFMDPELEFYHDKGGITRGIEAFSNTTKNNLCGNPDYRVRREVVPGTMHIYPMAGNGKLYGAILSGDHYFFENVKGKPEKRTGRARFTHLWLLKNDKWLMSRVISYDHREAY